MGDKIIITDDDDKPKPPDVVVVKPEVVVQVPKTEKVVTEKTTVTEIKEG